MQTWFSTRFAARFSTSSCGLRHAFDTLSTFFWLTDWLTDFIRTIRHYIFLLVRARARQIKCRKNPFRASQRTCWSWIFVTYVIIRAYHDVIKWKNAMKKLDFTPKNVINCVDNEPALWNTECTDVHPEITARIINSYHWLSFLEA